MGRSYAAFKGEKKVCLILEQKGNLPSGTQMLCLCCQQSRPQEGLSPASIMGHDYVVRYYELRDSVPKEKRYLGSSAVNQRIAGWAGHLVRESGKHSWSQGYYLLKKKKRCVCLPVHLKGRVIKRREDLPLAGSLLQCPQWLGFTGNVARSHVNSVSGVSMLTKLPSMLHTSHVQWELGVIMKRGWAFNGKKWKPVKACSQPLNCVFIQPASSSPSKEHVPFSTWSVRFTLFPCRAECCHCDRWKLIPFKP